MREQAGPRETAGIADEAIIRFLDVSPDLRAALARERPELLGVPERELCAALQTGFLSYYPADVYAGYTALAAKGPWIGPLHGAVLYETGGYGMLGFGHAPQAVIEALAGEHVMANALTPSLSQERFIRLMRSHIGAARPGKSCPYSHFACVNSGSEAMTVAARISDRHA